MLLLLEQNSDSLQTAGLSRRYTEVCIFQEWVVELVGIEPEASLKLIIYVANYFEF